jgi:hypothetical protein
LQPAGKNGDGVFGLRPDLNHRHPKPQKASTTNNVPSHFQGKTEPQTGNQMYNVHEHNTALHKKMAKFDKKTFRLYSSR